MFCIKILMLSPSERLPKASFSSVQNKVEKLPGNTGACGGEKKMSVSAFNYIRP